MSPMISQTTYPIYERAQSLDLSAKHYQWDIHSAPAHVLDGENFQPKISFILRLIHHSKRIAFVIFQA